METAISLNQMIDFTLLDARATDFDIEKICDIAYKNSYYSVCVNPNNVSYAKNYIMKNFNNSIKVVTVVGFPLGANTTLSKVFETKDALSNGADEIDVVINIGKAKQGKFDYVKNELQKIKKVARKSIVKAIIESCYFDKNEIIKLSKICVQAKIDFVKTSTGFGTNGADDGVVDLIYKTVKGKCKVKASGGIRNREQALRLINYGADRIGTSHIL